MLDSLTPDSIYSAIMMDESDPRAFLLVEGTDENSIFFGHISAGIMLIVCGGKRNLLGAVDIAVSEGTSNIYGLVDGDFDALREIEVKHPSKVVATAAYDLLSEIVISSAGMRRVISAHAAGAASRIEEASGRVVEEAVYALTTTLAGIRLASLRQRYPLVFENFNFSELITPSFGAESIAAFVSNARCKQPDFLYDSIVHASIMVAAEDIGDDPWRTGGHDMVGSIVALIKRAGGSNVSRKAIEASLIALANCGVLGALLCLQDLTRLAREGSGIDLFDCVAA